MPMDGILHTNIRHKTIAQYTTLGDITLPSFLPENCSPVTVHSCPAFRLGDLDLLTQLK